MQKLGIKTEEDDMRLILSSLVCWILAGCVSDGNGTYNHTYQFANFDSDVSVYKANRLSASFKMNDSMAQVYKDSLGGSAFTRLTVTMNNDSFTISGDGGLIRGKASGLDSQYIPFYYDSLIQREVYFSRNGSSLELTGCTDFIYDDTNFINDRVDFPKTSGVDDLLGVKCSQLGQESNMQRIAMRLVYK